jgi:hypothetical protein
VRQWGRVLFIRVISMDIYSVAHYMKAGYRVRRQSWTNIPFLKTQEGYPIHEGIVELSLEDLLANDWEVITDGIVSDFPTIYELIEE